MKANTFKGTDRYRGPGGKPNTEVQDFMLSRASSISITATIR